MGYLTFFSGHAEFELDSYHFNFLKKIADYRFGNLIHLEEGSFTVEAEWVNRSFAFEDMLLYIEKHGRFKDLSVHCVGEKTSDQYEYYLCDAQKTSNYRVYRNNYAFQEDRKHLISIEDLMKETEDDIPVDWRITYLDKEIEDKHTCYEWIDAEFQSAADCYEPVFQENWEHIFQRIQHGNMEVQIQFETTSFLISKDKIYQIPFELYKKGEMVAENGFILSFHEANEGRTFLLSTYDLTVTGSDYSIEIKGKAYKLTPLLAQIFTENKKERHQPIVTSPVGKVGSFCSHCKFRLREVSSGCFPCTPTFTP